MAEGLVGGMRAEDEGGDSAEAAVRTGPIRSRCGVTCWSSRARSTMHWRVRRGAQVRSELGGDYPPFMRTT